MLNIAVIGLGGRVSGMLAQMCQMDPEVQVVAVTDPSHEKALKTIKDKGLNKDPDSVKLYTSSEKMLENAEKYDAFVIGTRCNLHTQFAVQLAPLNKPLFLEKPVAITWDQVRMLARAYKGKEDRVVVSFPLRVSPVFTSALEIVRSGRLGQIVSVQAVNNVPYGGVYFGSWYRNYNETGGLWLQKATHDFDYINRIMGQERAHTVAAMYTHKVYGGDMPHDLRCSQCDKTATCPESPKNQKARGDDGSMSYPFAKFEDHYCAFSKEIRNEDAGSAILKYDSDAHVAYTQNFIARKATGKRGARIIGYDGTLEFDWYTDKIRVVDHHTSADRVDEITVKPTSGHGGGDAVLCQMYIDLIRQNAAPDANLRDGLTSASMCLAARDSSENNVFAKIPTVGELGA
jgi:predicted dehydrogenase